MSTLEQNWWSVRAAEYVLGTLNNEDYTLFIKILEHDSELQKEVAQWEQRLAGLNETSKAVEPDERVWENILEAIRHDNNLHSLSAADDANRLLHNESAYSSASQEAAHFHALQESDDRSDFWKAIAAISAAASLMLGYLFFQNDLNIDSRSFEVDGVAVVLSDDEGVPYFLIETDYLHSKVRVTALTPPELTSSDVFQLWQAVPDRSSVKAITRLPQNIGDTAVFEATTLIDGSDLFGVSIEANDASTLEGPLGPVVAHGDFLKTQTAE